MRVLIVEDEAGAAQNLRSLLCALDPNVIVLAVLESVTEVVEWIANNENPDLGFFDIRLADGESFEIFERTSINFPVIFTTGYDEYAIRAFKVNSIDYLLKPINHDDLAFSLKKYKDLFIEKNRSYDIYKILEHFHSANTPHSRVNLLTYSKDRIIPISIEDIAYFYLENEIVYSISHGNIKTLIDQSLERIWGQISHQNFFRVNRQLIVSRRAVNSAIMHFNRKLKLDISPKFSREVLISKLKVVEFKRWLEGV